MTIEILTVLAILFFTVILLVFEVLRIDLIAVLCMLALGWTGILTPAETLSGFSSNAVIAMMAVMIMGAGISSTGIMKKFSNYILHLAGKSRQKLIGIVSTSVGLLSAFMQNVGATALFLPAVLNISKKENIPASELIMPLGFAAILGGTLTMVASGPLLLLNDLLRDAGLKTFGFFAVTPVGLILLLAGVLYFVFLGKWLLPHSDEKGYKKSEQKKLIDSWHLPHKIYRYRIPSGSEIIGKTPESSGLWSKYNLNILAVSDEKNIQCAPWRKTSFKKDQKLALLGNSRSIEQYAADFGLELEEKLDEFRDLNDPTSAGFVEVIIPPRSLMAGKTIREIAFRYNFAVEPVILFSRGRQIKGDFSDHKIKAGDTLIVHGKWENMLRLKNSKDFVVITSFETEKNKLGKAWIAVLCFLGAIGLTLFGFPISISLFTGAVAMILTRVINIEEAYRAIEWKVVFLIAGLIPLGIAMQKTGTAEFLAKNIMGFVQGAHPIIFLLTIGIISTLFSLFMSNVASTVVLAPVVIDMARIAEIDPRPLVLLVAVCAANSFILPTHQVNAMLMTPGGYQNRDYFKAGGGMTIIFLILGVLIFNFIYI